MKSKLFLVLISFLVLTVAQAQVSRINIKLSTNNPAGTPIVQGLEEFSRLVKEKSQGRIKINLFPNGVLGSDQANLSSLQGGSLEMAMMNSSIFSSLVKDLAVFDLPFLFNNIKEVEAVLDSQFGKHLHKKLADKGIIGITYFDNGFRAITNSKRPINKVNDLIGLKLRVIPNPIDVDLINALGANAMPLPVPELYPALEQKAIDGNTGFSIQNLPIYKMYEVQKYLTLTSHIFNAQSLVASKKLWGTLSDEDRKIITQAAQEASKFQRTLARKLEAETLNLLKKEGMEVKVFSDRDKEELRRKVAPVIDKHLKIIGEQTVNSIMYEINKVRNSGN